MLSREDVRQAELALENEDLETRDEVGFLLLQQGFADRFFPGTSVQHRRLRYVFFVCWIYHQAVFGRRRGRSAQDMVRILFIELAYRLKILGKETHGVIGGRVLGRLTSQPPDLAYWTALRTWRLLRKGVSRAEVLLRLQLRACDRGLRDDDGGFLSGDADTTEVFAALLPAPKNWSDAQTSLNFSMNKEEREFLRQKLRLLERPDDAKSSLLARLVATNVTFSLEKPLFQTPELDRVADEYDRLALGLARDAAELAAIGRTVYGALVEQLRVEDGCGDEPAFRTMLAEKIKRHGRAAMRFNIISARPYLLSLPGYLVAVLEHTQQFIQGGDPTAFRDLLEPYRTSEMIRKSTQRARLANTPRAKELRKEWLPERHNTDPLHYRWPVVRSMLADLSGNV
jgi:hypothetical protein